MTPIVKIGWHDIQQAAIALADRHREIGHRGVWGIPTGGSVVAPFVAKSLGVPVVPRAMEATLIVDDLVDSGETMRRTLTEYLDREVEGFGAPMVDTLFRKPTSPENIGRKAVELSGWLHFPWETSAQPEDAVTRLLQFIGEDPTRDGLRETPARVCRALKEMCSGYGDDPRAILSKTFEEDYDEMVVSKDIPFTSLCEHHMLVYSGTVDIGYIPGKVVGLSKLARLVDCFTRRLTIQEKVTRLIAGHIEEHLSAQGVAVVVRAQHGCMSCRGVRKSGSTMVTSCMLGAMRDTPEARAEFLALCR